MDPRPFSLRDLTTMVMEYRLTSWDHTAALLAMLHNTAFGQKKPAKDLVFHPYSKVKKARTKHERQAAILAGLNSIAKNRLTADGIKEDN